MKLQDALKRNDDTDRINVSNESKGEDRETKRREGTDRLQISKCLKDFEDINLLLKWNELKKFVYVKRMLR